MKLYRVLIGLLPLTLSAACGSSDDDDSAAVVPLEDLPPLYAEALCEAYANCLGPLLDIYLPGEDCVTNTTIRVEEELPIFQQAIDDGRVVYHGENVQGCVAEIKSRACEDFYQRGADACSGVLVGNAALGDSCSLDEECVGEAFCDVGATCPGTCRELAGEGEECNEDDDCASGLTCSDTEQICEEPAGPGDLCGAGNPACAVGYLCAGANEPMAEPGNCRAYDEVFAGSNGDPCNLDETELCTPDLTCQVDSAPPVVASCAPNVGSGEPCRLAAPDQCPEDEFCEGPSIVPLVLEGTCRPKPGAGEPCGNTGLDPTVCAANTRCNAGTCKALTEIGGGCMNGAVCYSERCVDGECVAANSCE